MGFNYLFNNLSIKDQILSFLLVPILLSFFFFISEKYFVIGDNYKIKENIQIIKLAIRKLKQSKKNINQISVIKYIEQVAKKLNVKVINIKIDKSKFAIETKATYKNTINFISNIETNMEINLLKIVNNSTNNILMDGIFIIKKFNSYEELKVATNLPNPFTKKRQLSKNTTLQLMAIIGQDVCINDKWYKKDDKVGLYKIKTILKNGVELISKKKMIKLEIYKDD